MMKRIPYEQFKSEVCHAVKREGDLDFIRNVIPEFKRHNIMEAEIRDVV